MMRILQLISIVVTFNGIISANEIAPQTDEIFTKMYELIGRDTADRLASSIPDDVFQSVIETTMKRELQMGKSDGELSTLETPAVVEPVMQESTAQELVVKESLIQEPTAVKEWITEEPIVQQSVVQPIVEKKEEVIVVSQEANNAQITRVNVSSIEEISILSNEEPIIIIHATNVTLNNTISVNESNIDEVNANLFPWKKQKDCEEDEDWPKKIIYIKFGINSSEPLEFKQRALPTQEVVFNQSSIKDWLEKFIQTFKEEEEEEEEDCGVYDEEGRIIFIAFTDKNLTKEEFTKKLTQGRDLTQLFDKLNGSQDLVFLSVDQEPPLPKAAMSANSQEVRAQFSLREAVERLQRENREADPCDNDFENDATYNDEPVDCERFIFVSWDNSSKYSLNQSSINTDKIFVQNTSSIIDDESNEESSTPLGFRFHKGYGVNQYINSANDRSSISMIAGIVSLIIYVMLL